MNIPPYESELSPETETVVFGGGLAGLSAGYVLTKAGMKASVFEADSVVGGLSRTITVGDYRFDLGGHRFYTKNKKTEEFVRTLMDGELITVHRKSKIYLKDKFFDYPLRPLNALFGLGVSTTIKIIADYGKERLKAVGGDGKAVSLEDWVVSRFGRSLFNLYFKQYSEKVWGIDCSRISKNWVAKRIEGLSLGKAVKNAFFRFNGTRKIPTLADSFLYPELGIGRIAERLRDEILKSNVLRTESGVVGLKHGDFRVEGAVIKNGVGTLEVKADNFISTVPLTALVKIMNPSPPEEITDAASRLGYRDLIIVALMINREQVTDQSWIYIPEKSISLGRIHEPKNWSRKMAPEGKTLIVAEYFCFKGDALWNAPDGEISKDTVESLARLGFIKNSEVIEALVLRIPKAYPLFEVGYEEHCEKIYDYFARFKNLQIAGRGGMFKYLNMDHALESGMEAAEKLISGKVSV